MHYDDHLLITENLEEPAGVMEESETGSPDPAELCTSVWSHWGQQCMQGGNANVCVSKRWWLGLLCLS